MRSSFLCRFWDVASLKNSLSGSEGNFLLRQWWREDTRLHWHLQFHVCVRPCYQWDVGFRRQETTLAGFRTKSYASLVPGQRCFRIVFRKNNTSKKKTMMSLLKFAFYLKMLKIVFYHLYWIRLFSINKLYCVEEQQCGSCFSCLNTAKSQTCQRNTHIHVWLWFISWSVSSFKYGNVFIFKYTKKIFAFPQFSAPAVPCSQDYKPTAEPGWWDVSSCRQSWTTD